MVFICSVVFDIVYTYAYISISLSLYIYIYIERERDLIEGLLKPRVLVLVGEMRGLRGLVAPYEMI